MTHDAILQQVLRLPHGERAAVAAELLVSMEEDPVESRDQVERAWAAEIERRARRALSGASKAAAWPEVRERIERRLAK